MQHNGTIPLVSQNAVRGEVAAVLLRRLVFIALLFKGCSQKLRRNAGCWEFPERVVDDSFAETKLSLSGKRRQFFIMITGTIEGHDPGNRQIAVTDDNLLSGSHLV